MFILLDKKTGGALKRAIRSSRFKGEMGQSLNIMAPSGVRLDRISRLVVAAGAAFGGYVLGNDYLNVAIVEVLGIDRSQGVGAFGPFSIMDLARHTNLDKSQASRAAEALRLDVLGERLHRLARLLQRVPELDHVVDHLGVVRHDARLEAAGKARAWEGEGR